VIASESQMQSCTAVVDGSLISDQGPSEDNTPFEQEGCRRMSWYMHGCGHSNKNTLTEHGRA
jgi:hypothetical protein